MWRNYLKVAWRNLWKQKTASLINVLGLALGMACCFLIVLYVSHEMSYDRFHSNLDRLYRITYHVNFSRESHLAKIPPAFSTPLKDYFPEIQQVARLYSRDVSVSLPASQKQLEVESVFFADSTITQIFDFDFIHGHPQTALQHPYSIILTDQMAETLFGTTDVMGRELRLGDADNFKITGVIKDWPDNAHLRLNMLIHFQNMVDLEPAHARETMTEVLRNNWMASHSYTYVLLQEGQTPESVDARFEDYIQQFGNENIRDKQSFSLFPVRDIHLKSTQSLEARIPANINMLYLFIAIGILTLLIACINFINLTTASSLNRAKEVGVRKVLGARKWRLVSQFLSESFLLSFIAFLLSLLLTQMALPYLNELTGLELVFAPLQTPALTALLFGIFALAGLLAGSYPAFYVSRFNPIHSLKGNAANTQKTGGISLRKALITIQFIVSIVFISTAAIIYLQLNFLRNQSLGFQQELTISVPIESDFNFNSAFRPGDSLMRQRMNTLDELLLRNPQIKAVTQTSHVPGFGSIGRPIWTDQISQEEARSSDVVSIDYDFVETFNLELKAGRDFDKSFGTDHLSSYMINETAVSAFGWESPEAAIGENLVVSGRKGQVVGVVNDYHYRSLRAEMQPLILRMAPGDFSYFAIRLENSDIPQTLTFIEEQWAQFYPAKAFEYDFLDESLASIYESEQQLLSIIGYFAFMAILISCFGLFGMAALIIQYRLKEIGIRKILGASLGQILNTLAIDYLKLIALAMLLAIPMIWYFVQQWMENFVSGIPFPWWVPLLTGFSVMLLAFFTISSKTIGAALANPVEALRNE